MDGEEVCWEGWGLPLRLEDHQGRGGLMGPLVLLLYYYLA